MTAVKAGTSRPIGCRSLRDFSGVNDRVSWFYCWEEIERERERERERDKKRERGARGGERGRERGRIDRGGDVE